MLALAFFPPKDIFSWGSETSSAKLGSEPPYHDHMYLLNFMHLILKITLATLGKYFLMIFRKLFCMFGHHIMRGVAVTSTLSLHLFNYSHRQDAYKINDYSKSVLLSFSSRD